MTRRKRTKAMREFQIIKQETNEDGTLNMDVRVKNRPGRKNGGPLWNNIPYPMTVQERIGQQALDQGIIKPAVLDPETRAMLDELHDKVTTVTLDGQEVEAPHTAEFLAKVAARDHDSEA